VILQRARELIPEHRQVLEALPTRLSQTDALSQLLQSLDEAASHPTEEELSELFSELRAEALGTLMGWLPKLTNERVKFLVQTAAERLAQTHARKCSRRSPALTLPSNSRWSSWRGGSNSRERPTAWAHCWSAASAT